MSFPYSFPMSEIPPLPPPPEKMARCVYEPCFFPSRPFIRPTVCPVAQPSPPPPSPLPPPPRQVTQPPVQPPPPPPAPPPPTEKKAPEKPDAGSLSDATITDLNKRLNDTDETVRAAASIDLLNLLQKNPGLVEDSKTQPTVDAFLQKILSDPSELVRTGGEVALQAGLDKKPSPELLRLIRTLAGRTGSLSQEDKAASGILKNWDEGVTNSQNPSNSGASGLSLPELTLPKGDASKSETPPSLQAGAQSSAGTPPQAQPIQQAGVQQNTDQQAGGQPLSSYPPSLVQRAYYQPTIPAWKPSGLPTSSQSPSLSPTEGAVKASAGPPFPMGRQFNAIGPATPYYPGTPAPGAAPLPLPAGRRLNVVEGQRQ